MVVVVVMVMVWRSSDMNMVTVPGSDYLLAGAVVIIRCAGISNMHIVPRDDASVFAPPIHPAATTAIMVMVMVGVVVVVVRRADIMIICETDVCK